jgi:hypothetical protein
MPVLLSFGHGFSAKALSRRLPDDWTIYGTTRSAEKHADVTASGAIPIVWPEADIESILAQTTHLLLSAAPNDAGDPVLDKLGGEITKRAKQFEWVGYLSTTGVYGDHNGDWVDEATPLTPATKRGQMRKDGRGPFAKVRAGTARRIIKEGQVFSRIHVDDIAQILQASINAPNAGAIYNMCDDDPAPPEDVIGYAAELLGLPLPEAVDFETADMTPMARSFYAESKKVRNDRIKDELGIKLIHPDYKAGLKSLLQAETN